MPTNLLSRQIEERRSLGVPTLDLTVSNPTAFLSEYPDDAIRDTYGRVSDYSYQPDPWGLESAREAVSKLYQRRGHTVPPDRVVLTASTSEAYSLLFKLLCDPGDEILAPLPSYPLFEYLAAAEGVRVIPYRLEYDGAWFMDFASLRDAISSRTRAIVIVNPNNPTGSFLKRAEQTELLGIAEYHRLPLIADEVFLDYAFGDDPERAESLTAEHSGLSFSLDGLSKTAGMPQMKLGWIVVNGPPAARETARHNLELLLDTYLSVATPVQKALAGLLDVGDGIQQQIQNRIRYNHASLRRLLDGTPLHALHTEAGWSAVLRLPNILPEDWWVAELLKDAGVIVQPGYFFEIASGPHIVVSLVTASGEFAEGIGRSVSTVLKKAQAF